MSAQNSTLVLFGMVTLRRIGLLVITLLWSGSAVSADVQAPPAQQSARPSADAQREWEKLSQAVSKLPPDKQTKESVPMVEAFLRRFPNYGEGHFMQARSYEELGSQSLPITPEQRRHLENAVKHYTRVAELLADPSARFVSLWKIQQIYDAQLGQPADAERIARRMAAEYPDRPESHMIYARVLREKGDIAGAADVMQKGRVSAPDMPMAGLLLLHQYLLEQVQGSRNLPRAAAKKLLEETASAADAIIADPKREDTEYRLATFGKSMALELLAERVEQDRQRRLALLVEARRLSAPIEELKKNPNPNPNARPLTAKEAAALEWEYEDRWIWRRIDEGNHAAAVDGYQQYIATHPDFDPPIVKLADAHFEMGGRCDRSEDKIAAWQGALVPLQRLIGLAPNLDARSDAFERVISVLGPRYR
jgi:hypothetical protein